VRPHCAPAATTLDAPDARVLARFYRDLLGQPVRKEEPGWVEIAPPGGGAGLSFQTEPLFARPRWPSVARDPSADCAQVAMVASPAMPMT
jgi:hypothetical protein